MDVLTQIFMFVAFFLALKAIEYRPDPSPGLYRFCSVGAWVAFVVAVILWLV